MKMYYLLGILTALPWLAEAKVLDTATVNVSVTVRGALPCVVNSSKPIQVFFGTDVMTTRVDGGNYRRNVDYNLSCSSPASNFMKMQVRGTGAWFNKSILQTGVKGLGIALLWGGERIAVNEDWVFFNYTHSQRPKLEAVLVKAPTEQLTAGVFTSKATLRIEYM